MHRPLDRWNLPPLGQPRTEPCLTFAPLAWLKLLFFCHAGDTEIGGFGISAPDDVLYVRDFITVKQEVTLTSVRFLDDAVADFFDACYERGIPPAHCGRLWIHTHPGDSPVPSGTDEATFERGFGTCDWAVMMILARTGQTYARLAFNVGPRAEIDIPVTVDWAAWPLCFGQQPLFDAHLTQWHEEYDASVQRVSLPALVPGGSLHLEPLDEAAWWEDQALRQGVFEHPHFEEDSHHAPRDHHRGDRAG
jgi:hypothetical protein